MKDILPDDNGKDILVFGGNYSSITIATGGYVNYVIKNKGATDLIPKYWKHLPKPPQP